MDKKTSTKFIVSFMAALVAISLVLAWVMSRNYLKDSSKERKRIAELIKSIDEGQFTPDVNRGQRAYTQFCMRCHGAEGKGSASAPPLVGSPALAAKNEVLIKVLLHGMRGKIERGGRTYDMVMPGFKMIPANDLAHVANYIRNKFSQNKAVVTHKNVLEVQLKSVERNKAWTPEELGLTSKE
ncbi:MAG: hypothetical protein CME64_06075 [Halobacteriovoraceae bacterium]|nr:hypothetical protein [Halobacteriovoraceae bacterium]|tara:strand:+ start:128793 stop:129341 length:549 start_codon:yes stop_codon:yes gene_type:complete